MRLNVSFVGAKSIRLVIIDVAGKGSDSISSHNENVCAIPSPKSGTYTAIYKSGAVEPEYRGIFEQLRIELVAVCEIWRCVEDFGRYLSAGS